MAVTITHPKVSAIPDVGNAALVEPSDWNASHTISVTSDNNIGIGTDALTSLTSGTGNTALGFQAGNLITTGNNNFALGTTALAFCVTGGRNVAIGYLSLNKNDSVDNVPIGNQALPLA